MSKHTAGPWKAEGKKGGENWKVFAGKPPSSSFICSFQTEANAQLIAEAGTVATETGLTPRQLADQRKELLKALKEINKLAQCSDDRFANYSDTINLITKQAIAKAEGEEIN